MELLQRTVLMMGFRASSSSAIFIHLFYENMNLNIFLEKLIYYYYYYLLIFIKWEL